jgi:hypothetical protein
VGGGENGQVRALGGRAVLSARAMTGSVLLERGDCPVKDWWRGAASL